MPRGRPDNRIYREDQITSPTRLGSPITIESGREFRAFPPSRWSIATISRRILDEDFPRHNRWMKLVIRKDPFPNIFQEGGYVHASWRPVIIEVRNGGNRALARYRVACCGSTHADGRRETWSPATWARRIHVRLREIDPRQTPIRFNQAVALTNAYEVGSSTWAFREDSDTFGQHWGSEGLTNTSPQQNTSPSLSTQDQPSRSSQRVQQRESGRQTFSEAARAMGLG